MLQSHSEFKVADNGATVELATVVYEGREFTNLGSVVNEACGIIVGYVKKNEAGRLVLTTWDGQQTICDLTKVSTWPTPRSRISSTQSSFRATFNGHRYHGQGAGEGMTLTLRKCKCKS